MLKFNKIIIFLEYYIPFISWLMIIFVYSHIPQLQSPLPGPMGLLIRKTAHFSEYFILAYLGYRVLANYHKLDFLWTLTITFIFCSTYAMTDEYHQTFIYGRKGSLTDVLIDMVGVSTFLFFMILRSPLKRNNKLKYNE